MSLRYLYTLDDFEYCGVCIPIIVHHEKESGDNPLYRFEFEYKNCRVYDWYYHNDNGDACSWTRVYCQIIDKYGSEGVNLFKKYKDKLSDFKNKYIVIDNKVFKFDKTVLDIHPYKIHMMQVRMADDTRLDGDSLMNHDVYIKEKDSYSYKKTLENLRSKVENYFQVKKVLPAEEYLLENDTKEYNDMMLKYQQMLV